jgi:pyruvate-formate lyase-activating enzyme
MKLEGIGFYTLSEERAATASAVSPLSRCELILTSRCNFKCPYCRHVGGDDVSLDRASEWIELWAAQGLKALRLSGGEPTLYPWLASLVKLARRLGVERVALSTNGSAPLVRYSALLDAGVNDFSISLDACCAEDAEKMTGRTGPAGFERVVENIRWLAARTYVTVGVVLTEDNAAKCADVIRFASGLGVADIRIIPAAQDGTTLPPVEVEPEILAKHPILRYRLANLAAGRPVRGLKATDEPRCGLVLDDVAACGDEHFPCIIYMRESGKPIGKIGPTMRADRESWWWSHDQRTDAICRRNCLDVCRDYNAAHARGLTARRGMI